MVIKHWIKSFFKKKQNQKTTHLELNSSTELIMIPDGPVFGTKKCVKENIFNQKFEWFMKVLERFFTSEDALSTSAHLELTKEVTLTQWKSWHWWNTPICSQAEVPKRVQLKALAKPGSQHTLCALFTY